MGPFHSASDHAVLAAIRSDADAFEELFRRYRRPVILYAARRCEQAADVDDVVMETFMAALDAVERYDPKKGEPRAWLLGIAHNRVELLRRRERHQRGLEASASRQAELSDDAFARILEEMAAAQEGVAIASALAQLTADQREALLLVSADDLSPREAAGVVGISGAAFRVRLFRARRAMQNLLPAMSQDFQPHLPRPTEER